jgi:hypothetical protein
MGRIDFLWEQTERIVRARWPAVSPRIQLRSTWRKVYASVRRERIIFHPTQSQARAVPRVDKNKRRCQSRRNTGLRARASGRVHGRDNNPVCNFAKDRWAVGKFCQTESGNLGVFGKTRNFLFPIPGRPPNLHKLREKIKNPVRSPFSARL